MHFMEHRLDVRGLLCPLPLIRARALVPRLVPGDALVVLTTDPEARIDLAALATDERLGYSIDDGDEGWCITLRR